jgi:hypothetical protein
MTVEPHLTVEPVGTTVDSTSSELLGHGCSRKWQLLAVSCHLVNDRFGSLADLFTYSSSTTASKGKADVSDGLIQTDFPECLLFSIAVVQTGDMSGF